jgi:hypothetical protein
VQSFHKRIAFMLSTHVLTLLLKLYCRFVTILHWFSSRLRYFIGTNGCAWEFYRHSISGEVESIGIRVVGA